MGAIKNFFSKLGILGELFQFLWQNKRWWLIPVLVVLVVIGVRPDLLPELGDRAVHLQLVLIAENPTRTAG